MVRPVAPLAIDAETLALCERVSGWLRKGGGLPIRGLPLVGGLQSGLDFEGHREYRPGHDLRHVDWSLYARLRTLAVRTYEDQGSGTLAVLLDASGSMALGEPPKLALATRLAVALVYAGLRECHGVLLGVARGGALDILPLRGGLAEFGTALGYLGGVEARGETHLGASFQRLSNFGARGDAVVISDFFDPAGVEPALNALNRAGWRADLVQVTHADEFDVPAPGRALRDPESAARAPAPATTHDRVGLSSALSAFREENRSHARRHGALLVELDATTALLPALTSYFSLVLAARHRA